MEQYFSLYHLPESFMPDPVLVKKRFYELSRQFHPDRYTQASAAEQAAALQQSALNNEAYKVLTDADRTMAYVLRLKGQLEEEEQYKLPPAFLMKMMDLNELVAASEAEPDSQQLREQAQAALETQLSDWAAGIAPLLDQSAGGDMTPGLLLQIKDFYFRKKYLLRIKERLFTFAPR